MAGLPGSMTYIAHCVGGAPDAQQSGDRYPPPPAAPVSLPSSAAAHRQVKGSSRTGAFMLRLTESAFR